MNVRIRTSATGEIRAQKFVLDGVSPNVERKQLSEFLNNKDVLKDISFRIYLICKGN